MKKVKSLSTNGKSCNVPVILLVYDGRVLNRMTEIKDVFWSAVEQKYGPGYGLRYGNGVYVDSLDANVEYNGTGNLFKSPSPCPVGDSMLEDFKDRWDDVVATYPDPQFRKELVRMQADLAKCPAAFPVLYMLNYEPAEECFCNPPLTRNDHNKVLQNIVARYNMSKQNIDVVYVDAKIEDENIYDIKTLGAEFEFGEHDAETGEKPKIPCRVFHSLLEFKKMLLADEIFDVKRLNEDKKNTLK